MELDKSQYDEVTDGSCDLYETPADPLNNQLDSAAFENC